QTVVADNASLAVRWSELPADVQQQYPHAELRQPTRVILVRQHQLHQSLALYATASPIIRVAEQDAELCVPLNEHQQLDLRDTLASLAEQYQ
ncbi:dihydrofolate reductase family protein, partial [Bacillus cereus group sp. BC257]|uniref:dihydrofolate reductase family protein n=1 Tax=Bacillus cereus group sp. BC257 TaxID=3445326 RepID=UPI003F69C90B